MSETRAIASAAPIAKHPSIISRAWRVIKRRLNAGRVRRLRAQIEGARIEAARCMYRGELFSASHYRVLAEELDREVRELEGYAE